MLALINQGRSSKRRSRKPHWRFLKFVCTSCDGKWGRCWPVAKADFCPYCKQPNMTAVTTRPVFREEFLGDTMQSARATSREWNDGLKQQAA